MTNRKHGHYFKDVSKLTEVDVYRVLRLFNVTDQALGHAIKKLLVAGGRGAGKDINQDIQEAIDTLQRWKELELEDVTSPNIVIATANDHPVDVFNAMKNRFNYSPTVMCQFAQFVNEAAPK